MTVQSCKHEFDMDYCAMAVGILVFVGHGHSRIQNEAREKNSADTDAATCQIFVVKISKCRSDDVVVERYGSRPTVSRLVSAFDELRARCHHHHLGASDVELGLKKHVSAFNRILQTGPARYPLPQSPCYNWPYHHPVTLWRRCPRRSSRGSTACSMYALPLDSTRYRAHTCAGIPGPSAHLLRCRAHADRLPILEPSNRSLHLRKWRLSIAPHSLRNPACRLSRSNISLSHQDMGAPGLSAGVANGLCDPRQGYAGASWAARGR
jgi:hypothetical protein